VVKLFHQLAPLALACIAAQSIRSAVFSSGPKNRISGSGRFEISTIGPLMPGVVPGIKRSIMDYEESRSVSAESVHGIVAMRRQVRIVNEENDTHINVFLEALLEIGV
jgi:hypothetical protein